MVKEASACLAALVHHVPLPTSASTDGDDDGGDGDARPRLLRACGPVGAEQDGNSLTSSNADHERPCCQSRPQTSSRAAPPRTLLVTPLGLTAPVPLCAPAGARVVTGEELLPPGCVARLVETRRQRSVRERREELAEQRRR